MSDPIINVVRYVAHRLGWAIGVHGSLARDIDLIGAPWTDTACTPEDLVRAIASATGYSPIGDLLSKPRPGGRRTVLLKHPDAIRLDPPDAKGHWDPMAIDLSLMPGPVRVKLPAGNPYPVHGAAAYYSRAQVVEMLKAAGIEVAP